MMRFSFERRVLLMTLVSAVFLQHQYVFVLSFSARSSSPEKGSLDRRNWFHKTLVQTTGTISTIVSGLTQQSYPVLAVDGDTGDDNNKKNKNEKTIKTAGRPYLMDEYYQEGVTASSCGRSFFPTLTPPFNKRATYRYNLGRNTWAFEQLLVFANVSATIRTNVILLESGELWVHSPQYPTGEFKKLIDDLGHPVSHVVLPCNALEHKAPMKDFINAYPNVTVWVTPGQYGPFGSCGFDVEKSNKMPYKVNGIFAVDNKDGISSSSKQPPWANEFDMGTLYANLPENAGPVSEIAFCHRPTKTLVTTDAVVYIPPKAPSIFSSYFDDDIINQPDFWPKTVLQAVFLPLRTQSTTTTASSSSYPGYDALENKLVRAPILRAFADSRAPDAVLNWIEQVSSFDFDRIITSHFASPISATSKDFLDTFAYLDNNKKKGKDKLPNIACQDWELLDGLNNVIEQNKLGAPVVFDFKQDCKQ